MMIDINKELDQLRYFVWLRDIPSPGDCPEYVEHHEAIKAILWEIDELREKVKWELAMPQGATEKGND